MFGMAFGDEKRSNRLRYLGSPEVPRAKLKSEEGTGANPDCRTRGHIASSGFSTNLEIESESVLHVSRSCDE